MNEPDPFLKKLEELLHECEKKISNIELDLPDRPESAQSLSQRVSQLLESSPRDGGLAAATAVIEEKPPAALPPSPAKFEETSVAAIEPERRNIGILAATPGVSHRRGVFAAGVAIAALLAGGFFGVEKLRTKEQVFSFPPGSLTGLSAGQSGLFSLSTDHSALIRLVAEGETVRLITERNFVSFKMRALAFGENGLWTVSDNQAFLYRYDGIKAGEPQIYPQFNMRPAFIFFDQDRLWAIDVVEKQVDSYLASQALTGVSLALLGSYSLPSTIIPEGIYESGGKIWILDENGPAIRRYENTGSGLKALDYFDLKPQLGNSTRLDGLAINDSGVWVMDSSAGRLYRFADGMINWKPASAPGG